MCHEHHQRSTVAPPHQAPLRTTRRPGSGIRARQVSGAALRICRNSVKLQPAQGLALFLGLRTWPVTGSWPGSRSLDLATRGRRLSGLSTGLQGRVRRACGSVTPYPGCMRRVTRARAREQIGRPAGSASRCQSANFVEPWTPTSIQASHLRALQSRGGRLHGMDSSAPRPGVAVDALFGSGSWGGVRAWLCHAPAAPCGIVGANGDPCLHVVEQVGPPLSVVSRQKQDCPVYG
jgi:hypothetical protein